MKNQLVKPLARKVSSPLSCPIQLCQDLLLLNQSTLSEAVEILKYLKDLIHNSIYLHPCLLICFFSQGEGLQYVSKT